MRQFFVRAAVALVLATAWCSQTAVAQQVDAESNVHERNVHGKVVQSERDEQEALFNYYLRDRNLKFETKLSELKTTASVPNCAFLNRSLSILKRWAEWPTSAGDRVADKAAASVLSLYDRGFNTGNDSANSYEANRVLGGGGAIFPGLRMRRHNAGWEGYCSGLTGSTIRHPEPVKPVDAGDFGGKAGVVFQPSDIKALLTSIYNRTTNDSYLYLAPPSARDGGPNMGTFHLALANYIGQAGHPIGIDRTKGEAPWNNPIYAYEVTSLRDSGERDHIHYKTIETTITYSFYGSDSGRQTDAETGEVRGNQKQTMQLRYTLGLDDQGKIVGGTALSDSGYFLWIPLYAIQATKDGKVPGNPHIDVKKVIAMARASATPEAQKKFDDATIGPRLDPAVAGP